MNSNIRTFLWTAAVVIVCFVLAWGIRQYRMQDHAPDAGPVTADERTVANPGGDWPQFHFDRTQLGVVPGNLPEQLSLAWRFQAGDEIKSSPAVVDGRVYVGALDGNMYALDLKTGKEIWTTPLDDMVEASPTLVDGSVYIGTLAGTMYALDAESGEMRWTFQTGGKLTGGANWFRDSEDRLRILMGSYDSFLYCIDAIGGQSDWTYQTGYYINGSPAVAGDVCAFGGCDAILHVVSLESGAKAREIGTGDYVAGSAAIREDSVYVANYNGELLKASLATGEIAWRYTIDGDPFVASPAVTESVVVIGGGDMRIHCVDDRTGEARWTYMALDEVNSSPAIVGDKVVAGSDDGRLYLLRLTDGEPVWSYETGQAITSSPAVADGMVVVGCSDGRVYGFK